MNKRSERPIIVGLGEILWDLLPNGKQLGGAPANFASCAAALGARGVVISRIGKDSLGREIFHRLAAMQLERTYIDMDSDHPTGTVSVTLDARGQAQYIIHENAAWDFMLANDDLAALAASADALCVGTLAQRSSVSRDAIQRLLAATSPRCLRIFDINLRQHYYDAAIIDRTLTQSNIFKLNDEELPVVAKLLGLTGNPQEIARQLFKRYPLRLIARTRGEKGSVLYSPDDIDEIPGQAVRVVDTVGAGDAFAAALAVGLLRGHAISQVHQYAARVGAFVCTCVGATPQLPKEWMERF